MSEPQLKKRIEIPRDLGPQAREQLAFKVISFIQDRTDKGLDINMQKFVAYSDSYVNSPQFSLGGKSKNEVNLKLTEEMMNSIELLGHGPGYLIIGFEEGTDANDKAVWNQRSDNGPSRMFLGIDDKSLAKLVSEVRIESPDAFGAASTVASSLANALLKRLGI